MVIISNYRLEKQGGFYFVITNEASNCPVCQELLLRRGTRQRVYYIVVVDESERKTLIIRRLHCRKCDCIHHEIPDCIVPYKRYGVEVIENTLNNQMEGVPDEPNTVRRIRRWWEAVRPYFLAILQSVAEKYKVTFNRPPTIREIVRAVTNSNNWISANQICTRSDSRPG